MLQKEWASQAKSDARIRDADKYDDIDKLEQDEKLSKKKIRKLREKLDKKNEQSI